MVDIVKFNVGGHRYEISRSLLDQYPDMMLTKSASEQWQKDPNAEIFIERNGARFQYVLDFLRDGVVDLPVTESKSALVNELEYFGIDTSNVDAINDSKSSKILSGHSVKGMQDHILYNRFCLDILDELLHDNKIWTHSLKRLKIEPSPTVEAIHKCDKTYLIKMCNVHLLPFGLKMTEFTWKSNDVFHVTIQVVEPEK